MVRICPLPFAIVVRLQLGLAACGVAKIRSMIGTGILKPRPA
jgi:hypothetical protein